MLKRLRERAGSEKGFTLIELLVVMLILGILAAIAIPAFLNQKNKASDSQAKTNVRTMQTAMETWATDHQGYYNCPAGTCGAAAVTPTLADLRAIESTVPANGVIVSTTGNTGYAVRVPSSTTNTYTITRTGGSFTHTCAITAAANDHGGCTIATGQLTGTW
jgi:type IV pilus assembly protein PilA